MTDIKTPFFLDSTLRDGSHALSHQLTVEAVEEYCKIADLSGVYSVIVGHGNGLGASSIQVGLSLCDEVSLLKAARKNLHKAKLGAFMLPGFGTIHDNLIPALECGTEFFCIACHCTEADVTKQHIEFLKQQGKEAIGVLMSTHMAPPERILTEALKMQSYGADGLLLMDSAGALLPQMVQELISLLVKNLDIGVGFHAHNNLGLAVSNSLLALECGASFIDGTARGFGAGAGNCPLEQVGAVLQKSGQKSPLQLYPLLDAGNYVVESIVKAPFGVDSVSVISGLSGVFSGFAKHVKRAAEHFGVDPRDIFVELGRRKVVAGQEDVIMDVAMNLAQMKQNDNMSYLLESLL